MAQYRTCMVPMCRHSGNFLQNWKIKVSKDPNFPCPRHNGPTSKCGCTEPFKIYGLGAARGDQRRLWLDLLQRPRDYKPNNWDGVCSFHFTNEKPTKKFPFPFLYLGLERWQYEETLKAHFSLPDRQWYMKLAYFACKEPSKVTRYPPLTTDRRRKVKKKTGSKKQKKDHVDRHNSHPSTSEPPSSATVQPSASTVTVPSTSKAASSNSTLDTRMSTNHVVTIAGIPTTDASPATVVRRAAAGHNNSVALFQALLHDHPFGAYNHWENGTSDAPSQQRMIAAGTSADLVVQQRPTTTVSGAGRVQPEPPLCPNRRCRFWRLRTPASKLRIKRLKATADAIKREHQLLADRLAITQLHLKKHTESLTKCERCQGVTAMFEQSVATTQKMAMRLSQLNNEKYTLERVLFNLYGENRARLMVKMLLQKESVESITGTSE